MGLDELKAKLENKNEVVYPTGDYDKRERMAEHINEEKAALPLHLEGLQDYGHIYHYPPEKLDEPFKKIIEGIEEV